MVSRKKLIVLLNPLFHVLWIKKILTIILLLQIAFYSYFLVTRLPKIQQQRGQKEQSSWWCTSVIDALNVFQIQSLNSWCKIPKAKKYLFHSVEKLQPNNPKLFCGLFCCKLASRFERTSISYHILTSNSKFTYLRVHWIPLKSHWTPKCNLYFLQIGHFWFITKP